MITQINQSAYQLKPCQRIRGYHLFLLNMTVGGPPLKRKGIPQTLIRISGNFRKHK